MNQWISVEDRLPEINKDVLVFSPTQNKIQICFREEGGKIHNSRWYAVTTRNSYNKFTWKVTHWMPLPEIPKELKDKDIEND